MVNDLSDTRRDIEKEERWRNILKDFTESDQTILKFCADRNLKKYQFQYWRKVIQQRDSNYRNTKEPSKSKFAAVSIKSPAFFSQDCLKKDEVEIHTPHGHKIKFHSDLNTESLKKIIKILESRA